MKYSEKVFEAAGLKFTQHVFLQVEKFSFERPLVYLLTFSF